MSMRYDSYRDLIEKIDWEGGMDGYLDYAGTISDELPDNAFVNAAIQVEIRYHEYEKLADALYYDIYSRAESEREAEEADCE